MTRYLALALAFALSSAPALAQGNTQAPFADPTARETVIEYGGPEPVVIETGDGPITIEALIAETPAQRQRGLMWREQLADDAGMLFDFERVQPVSIWMENTLIPLDIIYIREDGTIAKIIAHAQPRSRRQLMSGVPVLSVLEVGGGRAAALGVEPGDLVRHDLFGTVQDDAATTPTPDSAATQEAPQGGETQPEEG